MSLGPDSRSWSLLCSGDPLPSCGQECGWAEVQGVPWRCHLGPFVQASSLRCEPNCGWGKGPTASWRMSGSLAGCGEEVPAPAWSLRVLEMEKALG